jgi:hypothetical protein
MTNLDLSNPLIATGHISLILLILGLFLPRLSLFLACFGIFGAYPANPLSPIINFLGWLFLPRFLWAYYIYLDIGTHNVWFWAYLVLGIMGFIGEGNFVHRRAVRRFYRNGNVVETVVEE